MVVEGKPVIVVGVSGSHASEAALRWAAAEADRVGAQLRVVQAWEPEQRAYYAHPAAPDEARFARERAGRSLACSMRAMLGPEPRPETFTAVVEGPAERALVDQASGADLLVLGSESGILAGRSIGPVIRACLSRASCPVVVVSPQNFPRRSSVPAAGGPAASFDERFLQSAGAQSGRSS